MESHTNLFALSLGKIKACPEARKWAEGLDYDSAWNTCQKPDWMLFLIHKATPLTRVQNELLVCRFAREVLHLSDDPRVLVCIETREAYARGEASDEAREAAIDSAWCSARETTRSAARSAAMDRAEDSAWAAAEAAVWDDFTKVGAETAMLAATRTKQCDIIRELIPQPVLNF